MNTSSAIMNIAAISTGISLRITANMVSLALE